MMQKCIKCNKDYQEADPEPYLCAVCLEHKKTIAAQVDAKFAGRVRTPPRTPLQEYDEAPKFRGFMIVK